jgi:hypothetical protein
LRQLSKLTLICASAVSTLSFNTGAGVPVPAVAGLRAIARDRPNVVPAKGYIPDERTAVAVGLAVLEPVYGHEVLESERPFRAHLENGVWVVEGTLRKTSFGSVQLGGTAVVDLDARTGRVMRMIHYK